MTETNFIIIDGRYRVLERVGSGGMADVYSAEDLQLGRTVAVKVLHRRFAEDADFVERFRLEASSAAGLSHPNVVAIYDRGAWDGTYYIAMEYLDGRTLKQIIVDEGPLATTRAVALCKQILMAARFAHSRSIIHRDLKPHNVIVDREGHAKVTDFGIAKAGSVDMTETGSIMGTAQYLSPEQAEGRAVEAPSDLYSVGVILYEMLTGEVPFDGDGAVAIALKHMREQPYPPSLLNPAVTPALEAVVLTALVKDPAQRFANADRFLAALDGAMHSQPTVLQVPPTEKYLRGTADAGDEATEPLVEQPQAVGRTGRLWPLVAVVVLVVAAVVAYVLLSGSAEVRVPEVVGQSQAEAQAALRKVGLRSDVSATASMARPAGEVISQDPRGGLKAGKGDTVTLRVSAGPGTTVIPELEGERRGVARRTLERAQLRVRERGQAHEQIGDNRVIETQPVAGMRVERGSEVVLIYSTGRPQVEMPNTVGKSLDDARARLVAAGLTVVVTRRETEDDDAGTVLEQEPAEGERVRSGGEARLVVAELPRSVAVPNVGGKSLDEARQQLTADGFSVAVRQFDVTDAGQDGVVSDQSPVAGRKGRRGSTVTISVGRLVPATGDGGASDPAVPQDPGGEQP